MRRPTPAPRFHRRRLACAIAAALMPLSPQVEAAVFKCTLAGHVTYQASPCASGVRQLRILEDPPRAVSTVANPVESEVAVLAGTTRPACAPRCGATGCAGGTKEDAAAIDANSVPALPPRPLRQ